MKMKIVMAMMMVMMIPSQDSTLPEYSADC